jgi:hypothetical protein
MADFAPPVVRLFCQRKSIAANSAQYRAKTRLTGRLARKGILPYIAKL